MIAGDQFSSPQSGYQLDASHVILVTVLCSWDRSEKWVGNFRFSCWGWNGLQWTWQKFKKAKCWLCMKEIMRRDVEVMSKLELSVEYACKEMGQMTMDYIETLSWHLSHHQKQEYNYTIVDHIRGVLSKVKWPDIQFREGLHEPDVVSTCLCLMLFYFSLCFCHPIYTFGFHVVTVSLTIVIMVCGVVIYYEPGAWSHSLVYFIHMNTQLC